MVFKTHVVLAFAALTLATVGSQDLHFLLLCFISVSLKIHQRVIKASREVSFRAFGCVSAYQAYHSGCHLLVPTQLHPLQFVHIWIFQVVD